MTAATLLAAHNPRFIREKISSGTSERKLYLRQRIHHMRVLDLRRRHIRLNILPPFICVSIPTQGIEPRPSGCKPDELAITPGGHSHGGS